MEQIKAGARSAQEIDKVISDLEAKQCITHEGNTQQEAQEPGKTQPKITREEYEYIRAVFKRLGCDSLINYSDFFGEILHGSFAYFFKCQPRVIQSLAETADRTSNQEDREAILGFLDKLSSVNELIIMLQESAPILNEAETLCTALDEAYYEYQAKENK